MLEKIKKWDWPVIWSVVCAIVWGLVSHVMLSALDSPQFEVARTATTVSNDTLYGFVLALTCGSVVCLIVQSWKAIDKLFSLPCFAKKRKK